MNDKKDYSLLRPFDLESAKAGELLIDSDYDAVRFVGAATKSDEVCVEINSSSLLVCRPEDLFMAPLAWVEGRPVYKGDVLYFTGGSKGDAITVTEVDGFIAWEGNHSCCVPISALTWQKPKTKREGWMNLYESGENYVYPTKLRADSQATFARISCIRIEWEE